MGKQFTDQAYFVDMIFSNMGIIHKICALYAAHEDREDLKQEIIYQLWKSFPSFRKESKFQSWMYKVALNTALLGLRARKVKYTHVTDKDMESLEYQAGHQDMEERIGQLYKQISKLKDLDKTIVFLYLEQCSYEEIAEITGISTKNVGVRLVRIRRRLRELLGIQNSRS